MKVKKRIVQYAVLLASMLMLLSVVIPHHHHTDGLPCYSSVATEMAHGDDSSTAHDCGCNGHNIAFNSVVQSHFTDGDVTQYLLPLLILFDYTNPLEPQFASQSFMRERAVYIESLHDIWIVSASGLRAPPIL